MDVAAVVEELGRTSQGLVTAHQLVRGGVPRQALARAVGRGTVVRVERRVYALTALPARPRFLVTDTGPSPDHVARVRALLLSLGPGAAAAGRTAAVLYGWGMLAEPRDLEVALTHGWTSRRAGVRPRQRRSAARAQVRVVAGTDRLRLTGRVQTALDCALERPLLEAVVLCDSALRTGGVTVEQLARAAARLPGTAGAARVRRVLELCDPRSGSVLESVLRVRMVLAGIGGFETQVVLRERPALRVDFCFADARLVVEVDGARWHPEPAVDRARDNALAVLGWRVLRLSWAQVVHEPEQVLAEVRAALAATSSIHPATAAPSAAA